MGAPDDGRRYGIPDTRGRRQMLIPESVAGDLHWSDP